ncbi:MAG: hypothetical protein H2045_06345 [Rhizobiales bacterium]|nr:hypothetical protein [Hyphomicrobiales bacterium]
MQAAGAKKYSRTFAHFLCRFGEPQSVMGASHPGFCSPAWLRDYFDMVKRMAKLRASEPQILAAFPGMSVGRMGLIGRGSGVLGFVWF